MNSSDIPLKISKAFGTNGEKNNIPNESTSDTDNNGIATYDKGFPPVTMTPLSAGGIPPSGKDMNGILYSATSNILWMNAGMGYQYDPSFSTLISGYAVGAKLLSSDGMNEWINTSPANTNPPEGTNAISSGWVPGFSYGQSSLAVSTSNVTLTDIQAAKPRIILTGNPTANRIIYFPPWIKDWEVENNCLPSSSSVILSTKTPGSTITSLPGTVLSIHCDRINITSLSSQSGRQVFLSSGNFTAPANVTQIKVTVTGGGGSGAGCKGTSTSQVVSGSGGGAGGTSIAWLNVIPGRSYPVVVGTGGATVTGALAGNRGGDSSFNATIFGRGGFGGGAGAGGGDGGSATGGDVNITGGDGADGQSGDLIFAGNGGASFYGGGSRAGNVGPGRAALAYGAGGGGVYDRIMSGTSYTSGAGAGGVVIVEY